MKRCLVCTIVLALGWLSASLAYGDDAFGVRNGIPYASGGIGLDSRQALHAKKGDYNLMVTLARRDGHYLGGATITIRDQAGKVVLEIEAEGPWVLAKLPPGTYTVNAKAGQVTRSGAVSVRAKGLKQVRLTWNSEPA